MQVGGLYDWNPFLWPLLLLLGLFLVYGPLSSHIVRWIPLWQSRLLRAVDGTVRAASHVRWNGRWQGAAVAAGVCTLLCLYLEYSYFVRGCELDERTIAHNKALAQSVVAALVGLGASVWAEGQTLHSAVHTGALPRWLPRTDLAMLLQDADVSTASVAASLTAAGLATRTSPGDGVVVVSSPALPGVSCRLWLVHPRPGAAGGELVYCPASLHPSITAPPPCRDPTLLFPLHTVAGVPVPAYARTLAGVDEASGRATPHTPRAACWNSLVPESLAL